VILSQYTHQSKYDKRYSAAGVDAPRTSV
jgi:hypothetical protein